MQLPGCVTVGSDRHCRKEVKAPAAPAKSTSRPSPPQRQQPWQGRQNHLTPTKQKHDLNATLVFTKAGNCNPPERFNKTLTSKLYFFAYVTSRNPELLKHFLAFYAARGIRFKEPGRALLVVSPSLKDVKPILDEVVHPDNLREASTYTSDLKREAVNAYLKTLPKNRYLMYPDLDEFFDVPSSKIDEALVTGDGFVLGSMVDRIAETWRLDAITNEPLWRQFPAALPRDFGNAQGPAAEVDFGADFVHGETNSVRVVALRRGRGGPPAGSESLRLLALPVWFEIPQFNPGEARALRTETTRARPRSTTSCCGGSTRPTTAYCRRFRALSCRACGREAEVGARRAGARTCVLVAPLRRHRHQGNPRG